jgi:hypothetical protein
MIAFDTETHAFQQGMIAPRMVCGSFAREAEEPVLLSRRDTLDFVEQLLVESDEHIVAHNVAFDMGVVAAERPHLLPHIFRAYETGRVRCTLVRETLIAIARGQLKVDEDGKRMLFSLAAVVQRRFHVDISESKKDPRAWRARYGELDGVPLEAWPVEAKTYAIDDARWHLRVFLDQAQECAVAAEEPLPNESEQCRAAFALHLMGVWGVRTDAAAVSALDARLRAHIEEAHEKLKQSMLLKPRSTRKRSSGLIEVTWSKDSALIRQKVVDGFTAQGLAVPHTPPTARFPAGQIKVDAETLIASGDSDLAVIADVSEDEKVLSTYVPALWPGVTVPICARWNVLVGTGRTSCDHPNWQNPPRGGGVRECVVPRPGRLFLSADYSTIELCAWAQVCLDLLGYSDMAEALRAGRDLHLDMAVSILEAAGETTTYDDLVLRRQQGDPTVKENRQLAKAANFGLPGGLGANTFCAFAWATYQLRIPLSRAQQIKQIWLRKWREATAYFAHISSLQGYDERIRLVQLRSGRVRAGCTFTSAANSFFQGLAADGAKEALWSIQRACYTNEADALFGCRPVLFLHDEFILEVPEDPDEAHAANVSLLKHMIEGMQTFIPDVPIKAEPALMRRWYKDAGAVYDTRGRLTVWEPR